MAPKMQAVVLHKYGPPGVLEPGEVDRPAPGPREVLIKVRAAAVNPVDCKRRRGEMSLFASAKYPAVLGFDVAGEVVEAGASATGFAPGDAVFGMRSLPRGGTYAEYAVVPAENLAKKPESIDFVEAASLPLVGLTALQALRDRGGVKAGSAVLVNGASGGVGTVAVQIAKALGATVTGVCSGRNADLVRGLGADQVLDYEKDDLLGLRGAYDLVLDAVGALSLSACRNMLRPGGRFLTLLPTPRAFLDALLTRFGGGQRAAMPLLVRARREDLEQLAQWVDKGKLRAVVDRTFPLTDAAAAHTYVEAGHARGKVVLKVGE